MAATRTTALLVSQLRHTHGHGQTDTHTRAHTEVVQNLKLEEIVANKMLLLVGIDSQKTVLKTFYSFEKNKQILT